MKGPAILQRPLVALPTSVRPVSEKEIRDLERLRFWAAVDRIAEARKSEKRALLAAARDAVEELRGDHLPCFLRAQAGEPR